MKYERKPTVYAVRGIFGFKRTLSIQLMMDELRKNGIPYCLISSDQIRDELYKGGKDFSTLYDMIVERSKIALSEGKSVILDSDNSGIKKLFWLKAKFGILTKIVFREVRQTKEEIYISLNRSMLSDGLYVLPWYFQNHRGPEWQEYATGEERGIAVAKSEIERHLRSYRSDKNGTLFYSGW